LTNIDPRSIANKYNSIPIIWDPNDKWHIITHNVIKEFISEFGETKSNTCPWILNAGSAGYAYGINSDRMFHIDLAKNKLSNDSHSVLGNIEWLPFRQNSFDLIICVGSVLDYCDPIIVMREFNRVLKNSGLIILEFESSCTFELLGKSNFNKGLTLVETFYNGSKEKIWYFSEIYIKNLLTLYNFRIIRKKQFHILSPLIYRIYPNETFASKFAAFDKMLRHFPIINKFCSNIIFLIQK
jgi:ubiquinone/menaquinone biosynthesis C-methylase UbiE